MNAHSLLSPQQFAIYLERTRLSTPITIEVHGSQIFDRVQSTRSGRSWLRPHKPPPVNR